MVGDVGHHAGPVESPAVERHMFGGAEGVAAWAPPRLGWVVGSQPIDISACEGVVDGDLDGGGGSAAGEPGQGGGLSLRVGKAFPACLPEGVVPLSIRGAGEGVSVGEAAGESMALPEGECGIVFRCPLVEGGQAGAIFLEGGGLDGM